MATTLADLEIVSSGPLLHIAATATFWQGPLHAAELAFPAGASLSQVLAILRFARPVQHLITIPEGLTALRISALIEQAPALTGAASPPAEGSILPQTYAYEWGALRTTLIARAQSAMRQELAAAWATRAPGLPLSAPGQAIILASIVERETALPAERPIVARVFYNRLAAGMKLQSDPTIVYGVSAGLGTLDRPISRADLDAASHYNTYLQAGLPVGPICNPGAAAINAVLHPAVTPALYFVADGTGGHAFAATLAEHNRNVARYRALAHALPR